MKITDLITPTAIRLGATCTTKQDALLQITQLMQAQGNLNNLEGYRQAVFAREQESSTGVGEGIAIPHAKTASVARPGLAAMTVPNGVEFDSLDGAPVHLLFLIAAPDNAENTHIDMLSRLSTLLMDENFRARLLAAKTPEEFLQEIDRTEQTAYPAETPKAPATAATYEVLAVTACPTGIAHTFMAAEALEKAAKKAGISLKVETNGSSGIKNALSAEEIAQAKAIIVAADKTVETARFDGKKVIFTQVAEGIHHPSELLTRALQGEAPIFHAEKSARPAETQTDNAWRKIYKYLMNGVSHMLPFVIGGGILIALSFLVDGENTATAQFGTGTPLAAFLNQIGGLAFSMMFPILAGYIALSIADRPALMPGIVGGLLAKTGFSGYLPQELWQPSGFLGALAAGFIAGYLILGLKKLCNRLPATLEGIKPVLIYPVVGILAIGAIMAFIINPPMAWFNTAINSFLANLSTGSKVVLGFVLGGMMSIDFGGPINKTAYVFGTAALVSQQYEIMAAVMAGGMVPPLAIALSTLFFKNRYTPAERQTTAGNFVMGLSFITEGAIPFAASDPLRVIPSCALGSAVAGALSMYFGCGLPAPHGGIFVVGIMTHATLFIVSLGVGALVGMALLALLKKPLPAEK